MVLEALEAPAAAAAPAAADAVAAAGAAAAGSLCTVRTIAALETGSMAVQSVAAPGDTKLRGTRGEQLCQVSDETKETMCESERQRTRRALGDDRKRARETRTHTHGDEPTRAKETPMTQHKRAVTNSLDEVDRVEDRKVPVGSGPRKGFRPVQVMRTAGTLARRRQRTN